MTNIIQIELLDEVKCRIVPCPAQIYRMIDDATKLFDYRAKFTTAYKNKMYDGYKRYINAGGYTYIQLLPIIVTKFQEHQIAFELVDNRTYKDFKPEFEKIDNNYMSDYHWPENHRLAGQPIILEDHQVRGINSLMSYSRGLLEASTGAGKTAMLACMGRLVKKYGRCLIIVPGSDLVLQTAETLELMGVDVGRFMGEKYREVNHQTVVATWQTIMWAISYSKGKKLDGEPCEPEIQERAQLEIETLCKDLISIICDEVQCLSGRQVFKQFTELFANVPLRYGMTGTIPKPVIDRTYLKLAIGEKVEEITTKELQEVNFLAQSHITVIKIMEDFDPLVGLTPIQKSQGKSWQVELKHLTTYEPRLNLIEEFINGTSKTGNSLVLCVSVDMCNKLTERLLEFGRDAIYVASKLSSTKRQKIYKSVKPDTNKIIVSTLALASTGIDIPALHKVYLVDCGKAFTKTIQAIGRGLRLASGKDSVEIIDIGSNICSSAKQLRERIKYYCEKKHKYDIIELPLKE